MKLLSTFLILCVGFLLSSCKNPDDLLGKAKLGDTGAMWELGQYHHDKRESASRHTEQYVFCHHLVGEVYWVVTAARRGHKMANAWHQMNPDMLEEYKEDCIGKDISEYSPKVRNIIQRAETDKDHQRWKREQWEKFEGFCANESCSKKTKNRHKARYYNGDYIFPR